MCGTGGLIQALLSHLSYLHAQRASFVMRLSYSVSNLRSLDSPPLIEIRPITILVGRNSSGKSTYLRSIPLIRQSIETMSSAPILWYGDLVDFGDFKTAVSFGRENTPISFKFHFDELLDRRPFGGFLKALAKESDHHSLINISGVTLKIDLCERNKKTARKSVEISCESSKVRMTLNYDPHGVIVSDILLNDLPVDHPLKKDFFSFHPPDLFESVYAYPTDTTASDFSFTSSSSLTTILVKMMLDLLEPGFGDAPSRQLTESTMRVLANIPIDGINSLERVILSSDFKVSEYQRSLTHQSTSLLSRENKERLVQISELYRGFTALDITSMALREFFQDVKYIGPARASSQRYYRIQELQVRDISSDGQNLPMFLASLPSRQMKQFSNWIKDLFGFGIQYKSSLGHGSVVLDMGTKGVNMADTGYGISQMLPVLAQIWWTSQGSRPGGRRSPSIVTIEQPELHLHPAHQAKLADAFAGAIRDSSVPGRTPVHLVIETHSEALINRLGELIEDGLVSPEAVSVVVFWSPNDKPGSSSVLVTEFDDMGQLKNWPYGFFGY